VAGGVGWLFQSGKLDREKVKVIREIVFAHPVEAVADAATTQADATTQPALKLEELLAKQAGMSATEQVAFIQRTFDTRMLQLDRRNRELLDLQRTVDQAKEKLVRDREVLDVERTKVQVEQQAATRLQEDKGFQDTLALYTSMPAKEVKGIFKDLNDDTVMRYLQAMQPKMAAKIVKEFKTAEEQKKIKQVLEKMRQAQGSVPLEAAMKE
jgi:hypothetical protein